MAALLFFCFFRMEETGATMTSTRVSTVLLVLWPSGEIPQPLKSSYKWLACVPQTIGNQGGKGGAQDVG